MAQSPRTLEPELYLLFARGQRPDVAAIRAFAGGLPGLVVTHDRAVHPASGTAAASHDAEIWAELLHDGLTFDLGGLAPGPSAAFPAVRHRFDIASLPAAQDFDAVVLRPGPHLTGAGSAMPLMRSLLALACHLVRAFGDLAAVIWTPANSATGRRFFESATTAWLEGGPFPALGLAAFEEASEGVLESIGLAFWIGQELRIEAPLSADRVAATRLGIRVVNHLVLTGGLVNDDRITAPDGTRLLLRLSRDRAVVSVLRE